MSDNQNKRINLLEELQKQSRMSFQEQKAKGKVVMLDDGTFHRKLSFNDRLVFNIQVKILSVGGAKEGWNQDSTIFLRGVNVITNKPIKIMVNTDYMWKDNPHSLKGKVVITSGYWARNGWTYPHDIYLNGKSVFSLIAKSSFYLKMENAMQGAELMDASKTEEEKVLEELFANDKIKNKE